MLQLCFIYTYLAPIYHSYPYLALFTYIYPLFSLIYPNLIIPWFDPTCHSHHTYMLVCVHCDCTSVQNLRTIGQLIKLHLKNCGIHKVPSWIPHAVYLIIGKLWHVASDTSPLCQILKQSDNYSSLKKAKCLII